MGTSIEEWRQQIEAITPLPGDKVAGTALEFLDTEHALRAVKLGWTELELFGMHPDALKAAALRSDAKGLVPFIALAQHTYEIIAIEEDRAVIQTGGGATQSWPRSRPAEDLAVPFWEHPAFRAPVR
jgi:hypothetical protein